MRQWDRATLKAVRYLQELKPRRTRIRRRFLEIVRWCPECTLQFSTKRMSRIYCDSRCSQRARDTRRKGQQAVQCVPPPRTRDIRGRCCKWCGQDDGQRSWSQNRDECSACNQARHRNACECGSPFYRNRWRKRPAGCLYFNRVGEHLC